MDLISRAAEIEERKEESAQNVTKEDLISRKAAIEALDSINCCGYVEEPWDIVRGIIERVPAAEPEKHTEERTETHACDLIDRRAALDCVSNSLVAWEAYEAIEALPAAQPTQTQRRFNADSTQNCALDCIDRQAAIEAIRKGMYVEPFHECNVDLAQRARNEVLEETIGMLEELPNAYPTLTQHSPKWIPCSERLPEATGDYLVTGRQGAVNKRKYEDGRWYGNWAVLAWMELPAPYKEDTDD